MDDTTLYAALASLFGLLIGSFLNVVIYRMPRMIERAGEEDYAAYQAMLRGEEYVPDASRRFNLVFPPSTCKNCDHQIRWYENIPVVSWLFLGAKCSSCKTPISIRYPLIEISTAALAWYCIHRYGLQWQALAWFAFAATLLALTMIDWDSTYLPDDMTLPLLWGGLLATVLGWTHIVLVAAVLGAAAGYLSLWLIYWLFKIVTGREGMGYGDFKLFAALGAWFGVQALIPIIIMASVVGTCIGIFLKIRSQLREGNQYVPFGPFLALGGFAVWMLGAEQVLRPIQHLLA